MKVTPEEVRELGRRAEGEGQRALAGLLYAVAGAEVSGHSEKLLRHMLEFVEGLIRVLERELRRMGGAN